ncbi:aldehyde dehydrogenase family protein, partial [Rhizobium leguminosarum]|uniref:aldehyde dehydrogenase family protein n=1 Tax=Rhizobium leguminosarum TaxID=384 RepID=UPI003F9E8011
DINAVCRRARLARIYVQSGIQDDFAEKFTQRMAALNVGQGVDLDTECGPMITRKAVEKIERLVNDAISRGARALCGGRTLAGRGFFIRR